MMDPSFSIVIPTFQRRDQAVDIIATLARMHRFPLEVIVVIDGSTDGTQEALAGLRPPFRLEVIMQPNRGPAAARNAGAARAVGDILLFLDDDMIVHPDLLDEHARSFREGADAVFGPIPLDPGSPKNGLSGGVGVWADARNARLSAPDARPTFLDVPGGQLSIRADAFRELGGFDPDFILNEDADLICRLLDRQMTMRFNVNAITYQRYTVTHASNMKTWRSTGGSDVWFARKHPRHAHMLFGNRFLPSKSSRFLSTLALVPGLATLCGMLAVALARRDWSGRARSIADRLFWQACILAYWRGVHEAGGMPADRGVVVLCYHSISDMAGDPILEKYAVPAEAFAESIAGLCRRGYNFLSAGELDAYLAGRAGVPRRAVLITFDDAYEDLLANAAPVLDKHRVPALAFAVTGLVGGINEWDRRLGSRELRLLGWDGLRRLSEQRIEIGAHSRRHASLDRLGAPEMADEIAGSARDIAAAGLPAPRFFAYPYGAHNEAVREQVARAGYRAAFLFNDRRAWRDSDRMSIPRIEICRSDTGWWFLFKVSFPGLAGFLVALPDRARAHAGRAARTVGRLFAPGRPQGGQAATDPRRGGLGRG